MNIDDQRFDPQAELNEHARRNMYCARPFIAFIVFILALILWAMLLVKPTFQADGDGMNGSAAASGQTENSGCGNGDSGDGSGAGSEGSGSGRSPFPGMDSPAGQAPSGSNNNDSTVDSSSTVSDAESEVDTSEQESAEMDSAEVPPEPLVPQSDPPEASSEQTPPVQSGELPPKVFVFPNSIASPPDNANTSGQSGAPNGSSGFYGTGAPGGNKLLFLVDVSGSMAYRIGSLQQELRKAVFNADAPNAQSYRRNGGFIIITYSDNTTIFPANGICRYRNKNSMRDAEVFINAIASGGGTMMINAWNTALKAAYSNNIDTIYFLSDGAPGDGFSAEWLLEALRKNSARKLTVHCISLGGRNDMMAKIAQACNGSYAALP